MVMSAVEALYNYESTSARGHSVIIQPGERFLLLSTKNADWWYVTRGGADANAADDAFYLPSSYVRQLTAAAAADLTQLTTTASVRHSQQFRSPNDTSAGGIDSGLRRPVSTARGFRLADPKRISKSIPVDLNFVHNIADLAVAQEMADRLSFATEREPALPTVVTAMPKGNPGVGTSADMSTSGGGDYRNDSLPRSIINDSGVLETSFHDSADEEEIAANASSYQHVYENTAYMEGGRLFVGAGQQTPQQRPPPCPRADQPPVRVLPDGWEEYVDEPTNRPYFYHRQTELCRWKPPRQMIGPNEVAAAMIGSSGDELDSSTYSADELQKSQVSSDEITRDLSQSPPPPPPSQSHQNYQPASAPAAVPTSGTASRISNGRPPASPSLLLSTTFPVTTPPPPLPQMPIADTTPKTKALSIVASGSRRRQSGDGNGVNKNATSTMTVMSESVDSGRGSLSVKNRTFGMSTSAAPAVSDSRVLSYDPVTYSEDLAAVILAENNAQQQMQQHGGGRRRSPGSSPAGSGFVRATRSGSSPIGMAATTANVLNQNTIKSATLEKCKAAEAGKKLAKRIWVSCFVYLTSAHVIFYKDEKSAEKRGNHYAAPLGVCDLRGAKINWTEGDKKRKHVFELQLIDGTVYLFCSLDIQEINGWFHAVRHVIAKLPPPDFYPSPVAVIEQQQPSSSLDRDRLMSGLLLNRSSSARLHSQPAGLSIANVGATGSPNAAAIDKGKEKRQRLRKSDSLATDAAGAAMASEQSRDTILERLKRFFRSRPTIESLKEKGIYKPEPVFGSSLAEICKREHTLVPKFITVCTDEIECKGLEADGLYRISGNLSQVQKIRCQVDQDKYGLLLGEEDIHVLTGCLKLFFRELQEPVFPLSKTKDFLNAIRMTKERQRQKTLKALLAELPPPHYHTLRHLVMHLIRVSNQASKNRMQGHNLAIVFGPTLFSSAGGERTQSANPPTGGRKRSKQQQPSAPPPPSADMVQSNSHLAFNMIMQGQVVEYLLKYHERLFDVGDNNNGLLDAAAAKASS